MDKSCANRTEDPEITVVYEKSFGQTPHYDLLHHEPPVSVADEERQTAASTPSTGFTSSREPTCQRPRVRGLRRAEGATRGVLDATALLPRENLALQWCAIRKASKGQTRGSVRDGQLKEDLAISLIFKHCVGWI